MCVGVCGCVCGCVGVRVHVAYCSTYRFLSTSQVTGSDKSVNSIFVIVRCSLKVVVVFLFFLRHEGYAQNSWGCPRVRYHKAERSLTEQVGVNVHIKLPAEGVDECLSE